MLPSAIKRFILPFSNKKYGIEEIESAAIFAVAHSERNKSRGLFNRQSQERIAFLSKLGYPLWLFPRSGHTYVFDGLGLANFYLSFMDMPQAKVFIESLEARSRPREVYTSFLNDHKNYYKESSQEKSLHLEGLIADNMLLREFTIYRKEASDLTSSSAVSLMLPRLDETALTVTLLELDKLQSFLKDDAQRLTECLRLVTKTTSQYITELDYEAAAATEETDAKIKALEEIINPQIIKLNKEYNVTKRAAEESFDEDLERLNKLKNKIEKLIERTQEEIKHYQREAKAHGAKGHRVYEKRWTVKIKKAQKEHNNLKNQLKKIDKDLKKISEQRRQAIAKLTFEFDRDVKLIRQPLLELQAAKEAKMQFYKQEAQKLFLLEKPVIDDLNTAIKLRDMVIAKFEALSIAEVGLQNPVLFYVPFYLVCYEGTADRRYHVIAPSAINTLDFSTRLRGAFGNSKIKDLLIPQFKAIATLIGAIEVNAKQNPVFENQLFDIGQKSNLLNTRVFNENVTKGLIELRQENWISDRERQDLLSQLIA